MTLAGEVVAFYVVGAVGIGGEDWWTVWRMAVKDRATHARRMTMTRRTVDEAADDLAALARAVGTTPHADLAAILIGNRRQLPAEFREPEKKSDR